MPTADSNSTHCRRILDFALTSARRDLHSDGYTPSRKKASRIPMARKFIPMEWNWFLLGLLTFQFKCYLKTRINLRRRYWSAQAIGAVLIWRLPTKKASLNCDFRPGSIGSDSCQLLAHRIW